MYYRGAAAAVVVYDLTDRESFEHSKDWLSELTEQCDEGIVIALAGNKVDLADAKRAVTEDVSGLIARLWLLVVSSISFVPAGVALSLCIICHLKH